MVKYLAFCPLSAAKRFPPFVQQIAE